MWGATRHRLQSEKGLGMKAKFAIGWYSKNTDASGLGTTLMDHRECEELCRQANQEHPELEHFPVDVENKTVPSWDKAERQHPV